MKLKLLAGAALAAVFTASSASAVENGWYGAIDLGWSVPDTFEADSSNTTPPSGPLDYNFWQDDDWLIFSRLGYRAGRR